jgi:hypothetical protein
MLAYCGLKCNDCEAFLATLEDNEEKRQEIAAIWSKECKKNIKPEDIYCHGCTSKGEILFSYCNICEIRKCAVERKVINCAACPEYVCENLERFFSMVPEAKINLDKLR